MAHEYVCKVISHGELQLLKLAEFLHNEQNILILSILKQALIKKASKNKEPVIILLIEAILDQKGNMLSKVVIIDVGVDVVKLRLIQLLVALCHFLTMFLE